MTDIIKLLDEEVVKARSSMAEKPWDGNVPRVITRCNDGSVNMLQKHIDHLEDNFFEAGWLLSYKEKGTIINARRPNGTDDKGFQKQLHCRARPVEVNGKFYFEWTCHTEYSPIQEPDWHIHDKDVNHEEGRDLCYGVFNVDTFEAQKVDKNWSPDKVLN